MAMGGQVGMAVSWLLVGAAGARPAGVIPADKRVVGSVVAHLAGPVENGMYMPTDVAVGAGGHVFVADGVNDRVVRFSPQGELDLSITKPGGQGLSRPVGLAADRAHRLWIADSGNHRLVVVTPEGRLIRVVDLPESADGHPSDPTDVAPAAGGARLYVADNDNHRVLVRNSPDGSWTSLGRRGRSLGQFQWPFMICTGPRGNVYVSEAIGARVQRISPSGPWLGQVGSWGVQIGQLYRPKGVAADARGRLFVSDSTLGLVQVFASSGGVVGVLTDGQGHPLRFDHPMGMCFDASGRLCVVELGANRVAVVTLHANPAPAAGGPAVQAEKEGAR